MDTKSRVLQTPALGANVPPVKRTHWGGPAEAALPKLNKRFVDALKPVERDTLYRDHGAALIRHIHEKLARASVHPGKSGATWRAAPNRCFLSCSSSGRRGQISFAVLAIGLGKCPAAIEIAAGRPTSPGKDRAIGLVPDAATLGPRALRECDREHTNL